MIILLKQNANPQQEQNLENWLASQGIVIHRSVGENNTVLGLVGDTTAIDTDLLLALDCVEDVKRIQEPYKKANRKFHPDDTVIEIPVANGDPVVIGGGTFNIIAGPCSVESEEQICEVAKAVKKSGATLLRGGAFKPRTSPYAFQGMRGDGLRLLSLAKQITGLPVVTEVMDPSQLELFGDMDIIQIGARNMQNFELLKEVGKQDKPVLLKRGLANTLQELLMSAEYIMAGGNENVILCERGIRTFETATRNTLDLSAIPLLHKMTHLPVVVDPSHACGISGLVHPMSMAAAACGADGLEIEVHNNPAKALCDGPQALTPENFDKLVKQLNAILPIRYTGRE